jgi:protein-S-isoprenylcysteine O-methyltransferase Ste14
MALRNSILIAWVVFWIGWLLAARWSKRGSRSGSRFPVSLRFVLVAAIVVKLFGGNNVTVSSPILRVLGTVVFVGGLALAIWARIILGRNWGMPMTLKQDPELVTSGPYRLVRHPIYTGILTAALGTALAVYYSWFIVFGVMGVYFAYAAHVEDKLMAESFPSTYPQYREHTKMLIPFVL